MINPLNRKNILLSSTAILISIFLLLLILPPEQSIGHVIKIVYLHAALVQTGLLLFLASAVLGLVSFFRKKSRWAKILSASQKACLVVWSVYILSSTVVTKLAWGIWIAWEEPRVFASIVIWLAALLFGLLVLWIYNSRFTAFANIILASIAFWMTKTSGTIRHPLNPIGSSNSIMFKIFFLLIFFLILFLAIQLIRLFHQQKNNRQGDMQKSLPL